MNDMQWNDRFMELMRAIHGAVPDSVNDSARVAFAQVLGEMRAPVVQAVQAGEYPPLRNSDSFKQWCWQYFGPDADENYLAEAVRRLPDRASSGATPAETEEDVEADAYAQCANMLRPHVHIWQNAETMPGSVVESFQMLLEFWVSCGKPDLRNKAPTGCYPEEWGPSDARKLTCACGNKDPNHWRTTAAGSGPADVRMLTPQEFAECYSCAETFTENQLTLLRKFCAVNAGKRIPADGVIGGV